MIAQKLLTAAHGARRLYWRAFEPQILGVRALVLQEDQVMLVRHTYLPGWYLPGGRVDRGETAQRAVCREVEEECGLKVHAARLLAAYSNAETNRNDHILLYAVERFGEGKAPSALRRFEIEAAAFFPLAALPADTTAATHRRLAEYARAAYDEIW